MEKYVWMGLAATLGTWFVTALGAATVVFFRSPSPKVLNGMLGFASGVMIAASFWSLLQPAIERAEAAGRSGVQRRSMDFSSERVFPAMLPVTTARRATVPASPQV